MLYHIREDITKIAIECIVNASNETGLGCFTSNHPCIDNAIHKSAGPQLLEECKTLGGIPTGVAKITNAYKLPSKYIIHVTGPQKRMNEPENHIILSKCYTECLNLARKYNIKEIAFCCISTGIYGYNKYNSAITAINTVIDWIKNNKQYEMKILFVTFTDEDEMIYKKLLKS
ncbi:MAG: protein-ADP-ribose hydrolase [Edafosvirus sp.]|uniref:Protein-ADP-ribose hydrolase n=1 Tax=Edafosvirus sp. TaxID=2487765 RepID=A0A3G4ZT21_9VIRU|nr:MAG: protein-ADP-ribose hydrolase [Edafosvirus sp.]